MQQYADIYLLQSHSTCFGCRSTHQGLRLQFLVLLMMGAATPETCRVTAVPIRPRWKEVAVPVL
jgi:hypothetical protein